MDEVMDTVVTPVKSFAKDSIRLVNKCTKPDRKGEGEEEQKNNVNGDVLVCARAPDERPLRCIHGCGEKGVGDGR